MNDYKGYGKYIHLLARKIISVGTLKMDYCISFPELITIGGCDCQIKQIFHFRHEK